MARYGIRGSNMLGGTSVPKLREMGRRLRPDHDLAECLWRSGIHEARMLAAFVDDPGRVTPEQMERWAADFDSWEIVDQTVGNLFDRTPFAWDKAVEWADREEEFVKRAGFAMMATLAVHDKSAPDARFGALLPLIEREASDPRHYVRKGVNWALRQIGKRDVVLHAEATAAANRIVSDGPRRARWVGSDALRELRADYTLSRLGLTEPPG